MNQFDARLKPELGFTAQLSRSSADAACAGMLPNRS
jgi:hypothetical protein